MRTCLLVLCALLVAPSVVRPDVLPPPAIERADVRCEKLNAAMLRLAREQGVPVRVVYANIGFIEVTIPRAHESAAASAGITTLGNDEPMVTPSQTSNPFDPARLAVAGIAISLGLIFAGIYVARRKYLIALTIALASFVVVTTATVVWVLWEQRVPVQHGSASNGKIRIVLRSTEDGPVRVTIPLTLRPAGYHADIIENYGQRNWTPPPFKDKK